MDGISSLLVAIPSLPLAAAVFTALWGPRVLRQYCYGPTVAALAMSFLLSGLLVLRVSDAQSGMLRAREEAFGPSAGPFLAHVPPHERGGYERVVRLWTWALVDNAYAQPPVPPGNSAGSMVDGGPRDFRIDITLRADALTAMMLAMVTFVATLVAVFAVGYMHGDPGEWRFFSYVSLFVFSMCMLVSVSNFLLLYVFWEAVGVCSYLLIGFWYDKPAAAAAGKKAFLVNRIGDFGFAIALMLIWTTYGTLNFHDSLRDGRVDSRAIEGAIRGSSSAEPAPDAATALPAAPARGGAGTDAVPADSVPRAATESGAVVRGVLGPRRIASGDYAAGAVGLAICLLLLLGACGKSAQFPLHVWLPDAMEGPTPVSALIHAATMVTAGVYLVARCTPLFMVSPEAQLTVSCIGAVTALLAGLIALTQFDLKRVLAYSTISQLGFMFLALGTGTFAGITAGMFHLFTHAFFKALLFLGAGSVMHAMGNVIDMRQFGGLRRILPTTHHTFLVGCLALAGVFPLAGFWSKDAILSAVEEKAHALSPAGVAAGVAAGTNAAPHGLEAGRQQEPGEEQGVARPVAGSAGLLETGGQAAVAPLEGGSDSRLAGSASRLTAAARQHYGAVYQTLFYLALGTALLTSFYTFRAFYLTFYGPLRIPREAEGHARESPPVMGVPLVILAVCSVVAGFALDWSWRDQPSNAFAVYLGGAPSLAAGLVDATRAEFEFHLPVAAVSTIVALGGWMLASYFYLGDHREIDWIKSVLDFEKPARWLDVQAVAKWKDFPPLAAIHRLASRVGLGRVTAAIGQLAILVVLVLATPFLLGHYLSPYKLSRDRFFLDEIYQLLIVLPLRFLADVCNAVDHWVVDGLVNLVARIPPAIGTLMRSLQMGLVPFYALAMLLGALVLIAAQWLWAA